jgi:hypothetical protein
MDLFTKLLMKVKEVVGGSDVYVNAGYVEAGYIE